MGTYGDIHSQMRARYATRDRARAAPLSATVLPNGGVSVELAGRTVSASPAVALDRADWLPTDIAGDWADLAERSDLVLWLAGRYVEAGVPNRNTALWETADIEHGLDSIAHGPLNWLHDSKHIIGTIADARFIQPNKEAAAAGQVAPYVATAMAVWTWIYPRQAAQIRDLADSGRLYQSMECVAEKVRCAGDKGCGHEADYFESFSKPSVMCEHLRARSSARHLVNPTFIGSGMIVPPARPGWQGASVIRLEAERLADAAAAAGDSVDDTTVGIIEAVLEAA